MKRRELFERGAQAAAGLLLGFYWPSSRGSQEGAGTVACAGAPNAWLRISPDNRIEILAEKPELGQGAWTYSAMMIAEELEADWSTIGVEQAPTIPAIYPGLHTGGSGGVAASFQHLRSVGAQARELLLMAAAARWDVPQSECRARDGTILHTPSGRRLSYGELACAAARFRPPPRETVRLKSNHEFRCIGRSMPRVDVLSKVTGRAGFGIDVRVPGMVYAVIARCPHFGGRLAHFDAVAAHKVPGVRAIFPVPPLPRRCNTAGGVAVVAESTWAALQGRAALNVSWNAEGPDRESSEDIHRLAEAGAGGPAIFVAVDRGDARGVLRSAARVWQADYESPFQAHATMEPMNTTIHVRGYAIEVWSPTQFADEVQAEVAALAGLATEQVTVHTTFSGGSFGRRYQWDYAAEAWQVAAQLRRPVQLVWTREDDMQHDFYRPYNYQRLVAGLDASGYPVAWQTRVVTTPISATNLYTDMVETPEKLRDPATVAALEWFGADVTPYAIANCRIDYAPLESRVPRSWWRGVSSSFTPFAKECFLDELAHLSGRDPLQFRLDLLPEHAATARRLRAVLQLAAREAGWGTLLPERHGRGIACRFGSTVHAQVAEVHVLEDGTVRVLRVVGAVDCGLVVNPDGVRATIEGGINFGLTAALCAEITVEHGSVVQSNFHDYPVLRLHQAPQIDVHLVPRDGSPSGVGELGAMLIAPAVANAVFAATGIRVRRLPIDARRLRRGVGARGDDRRSRQS
jgi:isoquinoline 1-oxidoreductase subunit beta